MEDAITDVLANIEEPDNPSSPTSIEKDDQFDGKIELMFKATGDAPIMKKRKLNVPKYCKIGTVNVYIRNYLKLNSNESLFLYVNQAFAPSLDQTIENLYSCYGVDGNLVIHYCKSQAWG